MQLLDLPDCVIACIFNRLSLRERLELETTSRWFQHKLIISYNAFTSALDMGFEPEKILGVLNDKTYRDDFFARFGKSVSDWSLGSTGFDSSYGLSVDTVEVMAKACPRLRKLPPVFIDFSKSFLRLPAFTENLHELHLIIGGTKGTAGSKDTGLPLISVEKLVVFDSNSAEAEQSKVFTKLFSELIPRRFDVGRIRSIRYCSEPSSDANAADTHVVYSNQLARYTLLEEMRFDCGVSFATDTVLPKSLRHLHCKNAMNTLCLAGSKSASGLRSIELRASDVTTQVLTKLLGRTTELQELILNMTSETQLNSVERDRGFAFRQLRSYHSLTSLHLQKAYIAMPDLLCIVRANRLTHLSLPDCTSVTDHVLRALHDLFRSLTWLNIAGTSCTLEAVQHFLEARAACIEVDERIPDLTLIVDPEMWAKLGDLPHSARTYCPAWYQ